MLPTIASCIRLFLVAVLALPFSALSVSVTPGFPLVSSAHADDDDGGDDGGDDDGDDDDGGSRAGGGSGGRGETSRQRVGGSGFRFPFFQQRRQPPARSARPVVIPDRAPDELVASGLDDAALRLLGADGFQLVERRPIGLIGDEMIRLRVPRGIGMDDARRMVAEHAPAAVVDFNHYYRPEQANAGPCSERGCALVRNLVGWPEPGTTTGDRCSVSVGVGLVDTGINPDHAALLGGKIEVLRLSDAALPASGQQHGTAVAALLVGAGDSRTPGLLPASKLIAIDAFRRIGGNADVATAFDLVRALDELARRQVRVVNMSLAGPDNVFLKRSVEAMIAGHNTILVAAVGNAGPKASPLYPAAYADVLAVTAVDKNLKVYRRANRGTHVDIAAPGVNVWTAASVSGARTKSGTSFAAPFVSAAAALILSDEPDLTVAEVAERLTAKARDIGEPGKDGIFGWGLLDARSLCLEAAGR